MTQAPDRIYKADSTKDLGIIVDDGAAQTVVTSTSYWGKRFYNVDYGAEFNPAEMGRGGLEDFIVEQVLLGRQVWDALADTGVYWLNIDDTNSGSGGAGGDHSSKGSKGAHTGDGGIARYKQGRSGLPAGQQCLIPQRIALALQEDGWIVKKWITWDKGTPYEEIGPDGETLNFARGGIKPEDPRHVRRPRFASETILMLVKDVKTFAYYPEHEVEPGDVWHFPGKKGGKRVGPAPFPDELPKRCILLTSQPGELVVDPCIGSGTTGRVAEELDRPWIGVDLYKGVRPRRS